MHTIERQYYTLPAVTLEHSLELRVFQDETAHLHMKPQALVQLADRNLNPFCHSLGNALT